MKGSTARKIVKIYKVAGISLLLLLIGGGLLTTIICWMIQDWKLTTCVLAAIAPLLGLAWLAICADCDKDKND